MRDKLYRLTGICTAIFAVLCCIIMVVFLKNVAYFDSHGKLGNLAELEKKAYEQEFGNSAEQKRNIAVSIKDVHQKELSIPLQTPLNTDQIMVREEFTKNKLVITLKNAESIVTQNAEIVSDSDYMRAIGLYKQNSNTVLELYCNAMYAYQYKIEDNKLIVQFDELRSQYEKLALVYMPVKDKSRFVSDEWKNEIKETAKENNCKLFICSDMQEAYDEEEVIKFANLLRVDCVLGIDMDEYAKSSDITMVCNPTYFIPDMGNVELGTIFAQTLQKNTLVPVTAMNVCTEDDKLVNLATVPAITAKVQLVNGHTATIEEEYAFNHQLMEAISATLIQIISEK